MFPWNIAKSAEAMFSRWAIKRVCKFLLKKKLGKFILGDVDLNQLDVQLSAGTVQLSDLALNVDYLNQKFGAKAAVIVKEGSIGSLMLTLPWKGDGCGIVVDELELVIAPCRENASFDGSGTCFSGLEDNKYVNCVSGRIEKDAATEGVKTTSVEVHEGVKTIANMVKKLLSSFHVTVKKLIVAFDPCSIEEKSNRFCRTLVLRIAEVECGTRISEDANLISKSGDNIIGFSQLTNFVKFQGAVLEFLQIDDSPGQAACASALGSTFGEWFSHCCKSTAMTPIITGNDGSFSGNLKLVIPWQNGSLDIRKVDADAYVDPLKLNFKPSTALCFMHFWNIFKGTGSGGVGQMCSKTTEPVCDNAASSYHSTMQVSNSLNADVEDCRPKALFSESHLISDWIGRSRKDRTHVEPDFGASVDQFFECLDELRSSQSALGNSGMWKWTSYISAITAATNLASGSLHIQPVQQHVETNFKVKIANVSILVSFFDEEAEHSCPSGASLPSAGHKFHFLEMKLRDLLLTLQVCPKEMNLEATVHHIELDDHFSSCEGTLDPKFQSDSIQRQQSAIQDAITPSSVYRGSFRVSNSQGHENGTCVGNAVEVSLLRTCGISRCRVTVNTGNSDGFVMGPVSFTLKLPPIVFWANLGLISEVLNLLEEIGSHEMGPMRRNENIRASDNVWSTSTTESLKGSVILANARIMLMEGYSSLDHLIALDFSFPATDQIGETSQPTDGNGSANGYSLQKNRSLNLSLGNLTAYLIISDPEGYVATILSNVPNFVAHKFLSMSGSSHFSTVNISWQDGAVTGPWITKKAKLLATGENLKNGDRFMGSDYECVSVTNVKEMEDFEKHARQDIVLSSGFFVHGQLSPVVVNLGKAEYDRLILVMHKLIDCLPPLASDPVNGATSPSQGSILVECESIEIAISMEGTANTKNPIQKELPGAWHGFRLKIHKFQLLSVSAIGGVENAAFLWASHGEGSFWGSITGNSRKELLLISCHNSARGRGDGQGSNILSPRFSGSDIVHFWDPVDLHNYLSIVVSCGTVVATGGRVDWWEALSSFFILPSRNFEQEGDNNLQKGDSERILPSTSSFVLNLVDVGVCYEPYFSDNAIYDGSDVVSPSVSVNKIADERYFACLLAASSFTLSNMTACNSSVSEYKMRAQDLGLLLCPVLSLKSVGGSYNVKHLSKVGYIKVAQIAHLEAFLRTFSKEDLAWEVESSGLDIVLNTCCDTTSGLIHLGAQLQQLFAPDIEDALVHLQSRWNNVQGANEVAENGTVSDEFPLSDSEVSMGTQGYQCTGNLMEEICEDAFRVVGKANGQSDHNDADLLPVFNDNVVGERSNVSASDGDNFAGCFPFSGLVPVGELESYGTSFQHDTVPEFIEEYFLSDLRPLSELPVKSESSNDGFNCRDGIMGSGDIRNRDNGWYGNTIFQIFENHISEDSSQANIRQIEDSESSSSCTSPEDYAKVKGRVLLKNINVFWRMYAGSDWNSFHDNLRDCSSGRDTSAYLEFSLSGMRIQYDMLPEGGICVSKLSVSVQEFFLNDNSQNAPWKLVLGYYQSKGCPRKSSSKAFKMDLESVRPDPLTPLEEYRLRVAVLPIRLHLHQSQLNFLINFFGAQSLSVKPSDDATHDMHDVGRESVSVGQCTIIEEALLPYFQKFDIWPVLIRVDYRPSHVDLAALGSGKYVELVNIVPWTGVELKLKHVSSVGIYGWGSVCERVLGEWLEDISHNQIHKLLKGLPPIRSLVAVSSGASKMLTLPVKNYRKERRLVKGVQRGTVAFLRSISVEAIGLGVHLTAGAHNILRQVEDMLASIPPSVPSCPAESRKNRDVRSNQPKNAMQGMKQAYNSISGGLGKSASALVRTPLKRFHGGDGIGSALATAVHAAPAAAIAPASATARAMHYALLGMRNSLDPEHKKESLEKYLGSASQRELL